MGWVELNSLKKKKKLVRFNFQVLFRQFFLKIGTELKKKKVINIFLILI